MKVTRRQLRQLVMVVAGIRRFTSKRLAPPMGVCNAEIIAPRSKRLQKWLLRQPPLLRTDLSILDAKDGLERLAKLVGKPLAVCREGSWLVWDSRVPELWLGWPSAFASSTQPAARAFRIAAVETLFRLIAEEQQLQWAVDHGLATDGSKMRLRKIPRLIRAELASLRKEEIDWRTQVDLPKELLRK